MLIECVDIDTIDKVSEPVFDYVGYYHDCRERLLVVIIFAIPTKGAVCVILNPVIKYDL
jgi:hypothetical protein